MFWVLTCTVHLTVCSSHVTYIFQSDSTLNICLNLKESGPWNRYHIWSLSDCNWTLTCNPLDGKIIFYHLAKLFKWLSRVFLQTYMYDAFDSMFLSCQLRILEWIHAVFFLNVKEYFDQNRFDTWSLSNCKGTRTYKHLVCKQILNWWNWSNWRNDWDFLWAFTYTVHFAYYLVLSRTQFEVNQGCRFSLISSNSLLQISAIFDA